MSTGWNGSMTPDELVAAWARRNERPTEAESGQLLMRAPVQMHSHTGWVDARTLKPAQGEPRTPAHH